MSADRYAVFGDPVAHSWSPRIHAAFAAQTGQVLTYEAVQVSAREFAGTVRAFFSAGGAGLNITVPHKQAAFALADVAAPPARASGAANTLYRDEGARLCCDNTDGRGLVRDLVRNHGVSLQGASVLLLGAGGAARGVLGALLAEQPARLHIVNRTAGRAAELRALYPDAAALATSGLEDLAGLPPFELLINATSAGLQGEVPDLPASLLAAGATCYDMVYAAAPTAFQHWARTAGATTALDGLGMLVEQAAESFRIWRGVRPETAPVVAMLRAEMRGAG